MHFGGDAVEEFLFIIVDLGKAGTEVLEAVFDRSEVGHGELV